MAGAAVDLKSMDDEQWHSADRAPGYCKVAVGEWVQ